MKTKQLSALKKLSRNEQSVITGGTISTKVGNNNNSGGGTNNGGGSGNIVCYEQIPDPECVEENQEQT